MPQQPKDSPDSSKATPTFLLTSKQHLERADALEKLGHPEVARMHRSLVEHRLKRQRKDASPSE